jgi:hypothetical protein
MSLYKKRKTSMKDNRAVTILIKLLNKHLLNTEEKEAILVAIGILSWTSLAESKIKTLKVKRDKSAKW